MHLRRSSFFAASATSCSCKVKTLSHEIIVWTGQQQQQLISQHHLSSWQANPCSSCLSLRVERHNVRYEDRGQRNVEYLHHKQLSPLGTSSVTQPLSTMPLGSRSPWPVALCQPVVLSLILQLLRTLRTQMQPERRASSGMEWTSARVARSAQPGSS